MAILKKTEGGFMKKIKIRQYWKKYSSVKYQCYKEDKDTAKKLIKYKICTQNKYSAYVSFNTLKNLPIMEF